MEQKKQITISIIIPVYKVSAYIERCLKSVMKQTYDHFECILVDDASPDDSITKCERMIEEYDGPIQFRILHHKQNRGLSAARNTGIEAAKGDYILFVDSDDLISNDCVEKLVAPVLKDDSIEVVIGEHLRFSDEGILPQQKDTWRQQEDLTSHEAVRNLYFDNKRHLPPAAWNKLTSREFINRHQLRFKEGQIWEDVLWAFFSMKLLSHIFITSDITYFYNSRPNSISNATNKIKPRTHGCEVCDIISENFTPGDESKEAALYKDMFCYNYIRLPKSKRFQETARRFSKALPFRKYPKEKTLLWAARLLPHNHTGREIFKFLWKQLSNR